MVDGYQLCAAMLLMALAMASGLPLTNLTMGVDKTVYEGNKFFHSLKENERIPFLSLELARGLISERSETLDLGPSTFKIPQDLKIDEQLYMKFQEMDIPKSFHKNLIKWAMMKFGLTHSQIHDICVYGQICAPDGTCFDTGDVGDICCPF